MSQFRRPWSPDPFDPAPPSHDYSRYPRHYQQRREPSDASVEALDLADYARTLRPPPAPLPVDNDYLDPYRPPSLISRADTLTSTAPSTSRARSTRRPFSLPPPQSQSSYGPSSWRSHPNFPDEADITQYPSYSREWNNVGTYSPDIYSPLPTSQFGSKKRSPFDPSSTLKHLDYYDFAPPASTLSHSNRFSSRDYLPWSSDPPEYGKAIDDDLKEERIRMLEREFGSNAQSRSSKDDPQGDFLDENGKPLVGTVDSKGYLVTQGPKKRAAMRAVQIMFALAAAIPSIYAAVVIKPKGTPPPSGKPPAYVLYVVSVSTTLGLLFLFFFYPCCFRKRKRGPAGGGADNPLANGMMVLPVQGLPGGKKDKYKNKGGKGKKGKGGMMPGGDVQVNLIVDPTIFGGGRRDEEEEYSEDEDQRERDEWDWERGSSSMPGGYGNSSRRKRRRPKRRSVFVGLAMEEEWKRARKFAKQITAVDSLGAVIWGAVFIYILLGQRCPAGGFDGWCNAYNVSSAAACLLCVAFCVSIFFDIKDLHTSKVSPRTRA
ncbi:hypothetical protein K435DRAFT_477393 [Dendrothele bispora CBS 962.96]|uniref:MARVEL domain-containing protein n=1 Tax=Dendrothele bispora (strain CBS 962.96) TaxID=1314807 RepID=A0A4S8L017_DENBC|nr:hypothetical protein K435DRAFT_477393 [Dendrothele bispora CBS 962.96]